MLTAILSYLLVIVELIGLSTGIQKFLVSVHVGSSIDGNVNGISTMPLALHIQIGET